MKYADKLKSPLWQKKRLEILNRDNFKCRACESITETLHVHHIDYITGKEPWEYEDDNLITLCDNCHSCWHHIYSSKFSNDIIYAVVSLYDKLEYEQIKKYIHG